MVAIPARWSKGALISGDLSNEAGEKIDG